MLKPTSLTVACVLVLAPAVLRDSAGRREVAAPMQKPSLPSAVTTPDPWDLEPLGPSDFGDYERLVRGMLVDVTDLGDWMVCYPSFGPEYAVAFFPPGYDAESALPKTHAAGAPWKIELVRADQQIWRVKEHPERVHLTRYDLSLEPAAAEVIAKAWHSVVRRTRYRRPEYVTMEDGTRDEVTRIGADGTTYRFCSGNFHGRTHEPGPGLASDLVHLAEELQRTVKYPSDDQIRICVGMAKKLQDKVDTTPW